MRRVTAFAVSFLLFIVYTVPVLAAGAMAYAKIPVSCTAENATEEFRYILHSDTEEKEIFLSDGETGCFELSYEVPGTYHYTVSQEAGSGTEYDDTVYEVDVYVMEDFYAVVVIYTKDSAKLESCKFCNGKAIGSPTASPTVTDTVTSTATPITTHTGSSVKTAGIVKTGDETPVETFLLLGSISLVSVILLRKHDRRKKNV